MKKYNGWANYETWLVNLWYDDFFSSDAQDFYNNAEAEGALSRVDTAALALAESIKHFVESENPVANDSSIWADMISGALSEVNWDELAEHYMADIEEIGDE